MSSNNPNNPDEYNGYPNYQTWAVALWIDNDPGESEYWLERAAELHRNPPPAPEDNWPVSPERRAVHTLADELKEAHEDRAAELVTGASVFSDLLTSALGRVDWVYLAESKIEDAADES